MPTFSKLFFGGCKFFFWGGVFRCVLKLFFDVCFRGQSLRPLAINEGGSIGHCKAIGHGYRLVSAYLLRNCFT